MVELLFLCQFKYKKWICGRLLKAAGRSVKAKAQEGRDLPTCIPGLRSLTFNLPGSLGFSLSRRMWFVGVEYI